MYRVASLLFLIVLSIPVFAQPRRAGDWREYPGQSGCVGGTRCADKRLRVSLDDRPVIAVRFKAHDQVGETAGGVLRVKIDGDTIRGYIDIPRKGELFTIDVDELRGRQLVFEPVENDEVEISEIAVLYAPADNPIRRIPEARRGGRGSGGWRAYPSAAGCIGGDGCKKNGTRITIPLDDAPVLGVRFYAHDNFGKRADGKLRVRIDDRTLGWSIDVQRDGKRHDVEVDNVRGTRLVIETANDDEVEVSDVEILYGRRGSMGSNAPREIEHEGGCIGGSECGGRRNRIRVALRDYPVESIRFYARDDVGTRAGGELRIRVDEEILRDYLDIPREGRTFTIDGKGLIGEYLVIETTEDDEVVIRDIKIKFGEDVEDDD